MVEQTSLLTFNGMAIDHNEFQQMGAIIYNETYKGDPTFKNLGAEDKLLISDAIVNKGANLTKQYPGLKGKNIFLQTTLDKVMYGKDSHDQRMSNERQNPGKDDKIPGTKIPLKNIRTKHYANFINTSAEDRNDNPEMKETNKAVIDGLRRDRPESDPNHRSDDTADGKYEWRGDGKTNTVR